MITLSIRKTLAGKYFLVLLGGLLILPLSGQNIKDNPVAIATPKGVWIFLGNEIPRNFEYQVSRKEGSGNYKPAGVVRFNGDLKELKAKTAKFSGTFGDLDMPGEKEISRIRDYAMKHKTTDSLVSVNLPVTHLLTGTAFFDPDAMPGTVYQYQVKKSKPQSTEKTSNVIQLPAKPDLLKPVFKSKAEFEDHIVLQWFVPQQKSLAAFALYRRVFGTGEFEKVDIKKGYNSSRDTIYLFTDDTLVRNPGYYEYYLKPMDIYGNAGPSSEVISAGPLPDPALTIPRYFRARGSEVNHEIRLNWKFANNRYVRGIELFRSANFDSGFVKIAQLPPTDTTYVDAVPIANEVFFYYMRIQGPYAKTYPTAKISAMFKKAGARPLPPGEVGAVTVPGGVKIFWTDEEPYLKGFFIFRYVYEKADYEQVSGLIPAGGRLYSFIDSSSTLTGNQDYRYAIKAVNDVEQMSDISVWVAARAGKKAFVQTPLNLTVSEKENGVLLIWDDLSKSEPNLLGYKVYRKEMNQAKYSLLKSDTLARDKNYFADTALTDGKSYAYTVTGIDFYGNESAKSLTAYYNRDKYIITPPVITRAVNTPEGIMVVWGQVSGDITAYKLYRGTEENNTMPIATVKPETDQYLDTSAATGQLYVYRVSVISGNNQESNKSAAVSLRRR
jgi:hypothetical protein